MYHSFDITNGVEVAQYHAISDAELMHSIDTAKHAHVEWARTSPESRATILARAAELFRQQSTELATILVEEVGKPLVQAEGEVAIVASIFDYYAENLQSFIADKKLQISGAGSAVIRTESLGPLLGIMPWNYPYYQVARFAAPNLALGNTVLLKHALNCPRAALAFANILDMAGFPQGTYQNLFISHDQVRLVLEHSSVCGVSLTGSERAGAAVAEIAGRNLKKCVLELGGSDPILVFDDADLQAAAQAATANRMTNGGQTCTASKRFLVASQVVDDFVELLKQEYRKYKVGNPHAADTTLGPLSSPDAAAHQQELVDDAIERGATILIDGGRVDNSSFFEPMLLTDITPEMRIYNEEAFSPVACLYTFNNPEEALSIANNSPYGLAASVFTNDDATWELVASRLEAGMVWRNSTSKSAPDLPFGGIKRSGFGRELAQFGFCEFANLKLIRTP